MCFGYAAIRDLAPKPYRVLPASCGYSVLLRIAFTEDAM